MTTKAVRYAMPSGAWIEVKDINSLTRQERRDIRVRIAEFGAGTDRTSTRSLLDAEAAMEDGLLYPEMITAWSYKTPLPPTPEVLDEVFGPRATDEMALKTLANQWFNSLYPSFAPVMVETNGKGKVLDPKALTSLSSQ